MGTEKGTWHRFKPFETELFENYSRSESALIATMAEMVINGVSTRKIARITETLCGKTVSKSAVSNICQRLSEQVEEFRSRPLTKSYPFLTVDATYFRVREHHKITSKALFSLHTQPAAKAIEKSSVLKYTKQNQPLIGKISSSDSRSGVSMESR